MHHTTRDLNRTFPIGSRQRNEANAMRPLRGVATQPHVTRISDDCALRLDSAGYGAVGMALWLT